MTSESEPRQKRAMALGLAALLFGAGAAAGVAVDRWVAGGERRGEGPRSWGRRPEALAKRYREELRLDEAQGRAVEEILRRTWDETRRSFAPVEPKVDAIRRRGDDEIRALLRPDQKPRFEELVAEHERRREAIRRGSDLPKPEVR